MNIQKIFKNALSNGAAFAVEAISAFVMMPFVVHRIGDSAYGVWILINALSGYLGFFKLGLRPAVNKHVAQYKALNQFGLLRDFMQAGLSIYSYCGILILWATVILYFSVEHIFTIDPRYLSSVKIIVAMAGVHAVFGLLGTLFGGVISGYQHYEINAGIEIAVIVLRSLLIFILLPHFPDLLTLATTHFFFTILGYIAAVIVSQRLAPIRGLKPFKKPSREAVSAIVKFSLISVGISGIGILMTYADNIIVGMVLSTAAITHYAVGGRLVTYTNNLLQVLSNVLAPAVSELNAQKENTAIRQIMIYGVKAACFLSFPVLLCLIVQGKEFIQLWMGAGYEISYYVMVILAIAAFAALPQQITNPILYGLGKHKLLLYRSLMEAVLSLVLGYMLGKKYGVIGVAIGFSLPRTMFRGVIFPILVYRIVGLNGLEVFMKSYGRIGLASIPFVIALVLMKKYEMLNSWPTFIMQIVACSSIYLVSSWFLGFTQEERTNVTKGFWIRGRNRNASIPSNQIEQVPKEPRKL
ncbi:MAG: oligosaccharide flippase family protein [Desulfobulbaceae bacterium]|nr:oligosaccharide flippase family protein [Desulfobulbaceae bacterium]